MIALQRRRSPAGTGLDRRNTSFGSDHSASHSARKLPLYAREVIAASAAGRSPNVYVFAGDSAWQRAQRRRWAHGAGSAVAVPLDSEPGAFDWTFLRGQAVVLAAEAITPINRPEYVALAAELIVAGVRFVAASDGRETFSMRGQGRAT
jgi:hypothetical protein